MRQIDVAHEAEDQREAARDEEIEAAQGDPVEHSVEEELLSAEDRLEAGGPRGKHEPNQRDHQNCDDQGPDRTARNEAVHWQPFEERIGGPAIAPRRVARAFANSPAITKPYLPL